MEEKKTKIISMNADRNNGNNKPEGSKLTYEQLNDACNQLWQQNKQLVQRNRELEGFAMNKRLDYLFKCLEYSKMFSSDFVVSCTAEIEEAMTIPQETEEYKEEK